MNLPGNEYKEGMWILVREVKKNYSVLEATLRNLDFLNRNGELL